MFVFTLESNFEPSSLIILEWWTASWIRGAALSLQSFELLWGSYFANNYSSPPAQTSECLAVAKGLNTSHSPLPYLY